MSRFRRAATAAGAALCATTALAAAPASAVTPAAHFPVPVAASGTAQVITVEASGSRAIVIAWQRTRTGVWIREAATASARVGANGITDGATRRQGTDTTPTGTYSLTQGFGLGPDPGTRLPYHRVGPLDWWVEDPQSPYYNQLRRSDQGGFPLTESGPRGSEHLVNYPVQYRNAVVVDFNRRPAVPGRGAGIFLHDLGPEGGPTAGCVAVPAGVLTAILRWIDPAQHPVIAIG